MVSNAELDAWLVERRRERAFLQSNPVLEVPHWYDDEVAVAMDWALDRGWPAEGWRVFHPRVVREALEHGVDPSVYHGQPEWKTVWTSDDTSLRVDWTGVYPAELEIAEEGEPTPGGDAVEMVLNQDDHLWHLRDAHGNMTVRGFVNADEAEEQLSVRLRDIDGLSFDVYTVQLEQQKIIKDENGDDRIVPIAWTPEWVGAPSSREEWFIDKLDAIARSAGREVAELIAELISDDPRKLASVYNDIVSYFGVYEFDQEPMRLNEEELNERWSR